MTPPTSPTPTIRPATPASRLVAKRPDWIEVAIQWASGAAAVAMFAYGVALSYAVLYGVAAAAELPGWAARLWPLGFEAFMASAALNALAEQRHRRHLAGPRRVPWYPWTLTALTAGGSILLNWFHPAIPLDPPPGWLVSLVYGLPPLIAVFAWHLFLQRVAHRRHQAPTPAGTVLAAVPHRASPVSQQDRHQDQDGQAGTVATDTGPAPTAPAPAEHPFRPRPAAPRPTAGTTGGLDAGLLAQARAAAAEHANTHGRPISRDALRQALRVSNQTAGALLRQLRADPTDPHRQDQDGATGIGTSVPQEASRSAPTQRGPVAGNGAAGGEAAGVAALVPGPVLGRDRQDGAGGA